MTKEEALKIWDDIYEKELWVQDCYGTWIYRNDYGEYETMRKRPGGKGVLYNYGWELDHIRPKNNFENEEDADFYNNYEPVHYKNNRKKSDKLEFVIHNKKYKVVECNLCRENGLLGYGIEDVASNN